MNKETLSAETVTIQIYARTDKVGSKSTRTVTWDRHEWEEMPESEKHEAMLEAFWQSGMVDWGWKVRT